MATRRFVADTLVTLALATAIHMDWHAARPAELHLSLGWHWHWLLAIPVFALAAWYVARAWPKRAIGMSLWIVAAAAVLGGFLEPAWEYWVEGATFEWTFGHTRTAALIAFLAAGAVTHAIVLSVLAPRVSRP